MSGIDEYPTEGVIAAARAAHLRYVRVLHIREMCQTAINGDRCVESGPNDWTDRHWLAQSVLNVLDGAVDHQIIGEVNAGQHMQRDAVFPKPDDVEHVRLERLRTALSDWEKYTGFASNGPVPSYMREMIRAAKAVVAPLPNPKHTCIYDDHGPDSDCLACKA